MPFSALTDEPDPLAGSFADDGHWLSPPAPAARSPDALLADAPTRARIEAAVAALPEAQRAVIELRDMAELESDEICELLDISESNFRVLLHRARHSVRQAFGQR